MIEFYKKLYLRSKMTLRAAIKQRDTMTSSHTNCIHSDEVEDSTAEDSDGGNESDDTDDSDSDAGDNCGDNTDVLSSFVNLNNGDKNFVDEQVANLGALLDGYDDSSN